MIGLHEQSDVRNGNRVASNVGGADTGKPGAGGKVPVGRAVPCAPLSAIYWFNDQQVGQWSDVATIVVMG
jgi:hypothetical protein